MKLKWQDREKLRFVNGKYKPVVWTDEPWWKEIPGHYAHVSIKDPANIAFTASDAKGEADSQVIMKPGKYLQKFFGDTMTPKQVRDYAIQHALKYDLTDLKFVSTPKEIERVYKAQLGSCFSGTTQANLYGSGDFAIAYLEKNNKVTARAVTAPERKIYVRPYGDYERLNDSLEKAGYRETTAGKDWDGLKLLQEWWWDGFYADFYGCDFPKLNDKYRVVRDY